MAANIVNICKHLISDIRTSLLLLCFFVFCFVLQWNSLTVCVLRFRTSDKWRWRWRHWHQRRAFCPIPVHTGFPQTANSRCNVRKWIQTLFILGHFFTMFLLLFIVWWEPMFLFAVWSSPWGISQWTASVWSRGITSRDASWRTSTSTLAFAFPTAATRANTFMSFRSFQKTSVSLPLLAWW